MIRWKGKSTNGILKWWAEADNFTDLLEQLCYTKAHGICEPISVVDYVPYDKEKCEKAQIDYYDIVCDVDKDWDDIQKELDELPDLTDEDIWLLISHENGNAYYQNFYRWNDDEKIWIESNDDDKKWFDENGKFVL